MATALEALVEFLQSGTMRRALAAVVGLALPWLNAKLGLNVPSEQVVAALVVVVGYIAQSVSNEMHARKVGAEAAVAVKTSEDAVKVLGEAPKP